MVLRKSDWRMCLSQEMWRAGSDKEYVHNLGNQQNISNDVCETDMDRQWVSLSEGEMEAGHFFIWSQLSYTSPLCSLYIRDNPSPSPLT